MVHYDFQDEENSTPITDDGDVVLGANSRAYGLVTLPTTYKFYLITGIEWKNGGVIDGSVRCGADVVNADPITLARTTICAWGEQDLQSGADSIQRCSGVRSILIPGGTVIGAWINSNSATAEFRSDADAGLGSDPIRRAWAFTTDPSFITTTSFSSSVERFYIKVYYRGVG